MLTGEYDWSNTPAMAQKTADKIEGAKVGSPRGITMTSALNTCVGESDARIGSLPGDGESEEVCASLAGGYRLHPTDTQELTQEAHDYIPNYMYKG